MKDSYQTLAPADAALSHLADRAALLGLSPTALSGLSLKAVHDLGAGPIVVKVRQEQDGIEVFNKEVNLVMDRQRRLVALSGDLSSHLATSQDRARSQRPLAESFPLEAAGAIASAYRDLGGDPGALQLAHTRSAPPYEHFRAANTDGLRLLGEQRAKQVYFDLGDRLVGAYYLELDAFDPARGTRRSTGMVVSAEDGQVLFQANRLLSAEPFSYRAYASPESLQPESTPYCGQGIPHPTGLLDGYLPATPCAQSLLTLAHAGIGTGDPWLADDATETVGNNTDVFFHLLYDANYNYFPDGYLPENGDFRAPLSSARTFDFSTTWTMR